MSEFWSQISEGLFHRHHINPLTTMLKNEGCMLAALALKMIFDLSFAVVLDCVRERSPQSRECVSHLCDVMRIRLAVQRERCSRRTQGRASAIRNVPERKFACHIHAV